MNKRVLILAVVIFSCVGICFADSTIFLKSGKKIKGQIVEKDADKVKVDISGVKVTYFMNEIDKIEENTQTSTPPAAQPPKPASSNQSSSTTPPKSEPAAKTESVATVPAAEPIEPPKSDVKPSANKKDLVLKLIEISGTRESMTDMFSQIVQNAPVDQQQTVRELLNINEVIERLVPVYEKYFSNEDLNDLITFYKGTTGRKLIHVMPQLMEDSMTASMTYLKEKIPSLEQPKAEK